MQFCKMNFKLTIKNWECSFGIGKSSKNLKIQDQHQGNNYLQFYNYFEKYCMKSGGGKSLHVKYILLL